MMRNPYGQSQNIGQILAGNQQALASYQMPQQNTGWIDAVMPLIGQLVGQMSEKDKTNPKTEQKVEGKIEPKIPQSNISNPSRRIPKFMNY